MHGQDSRHSHLPQGTAIQYNPGERWSGGRTGGGTEGQVSGTVAGNTKNSSISSLMEAAQNDSS